MRESYQIGANKRATKIIPLFRTNPDGKRGEQCTSFRDQAEMMKVMEMVDDQGRSLYDHDPSFRATVESILANTEASTIGVQLEPVTPIPDDAAMLKGLYEDAARQRYHQLVDKAGGGDLIAKLELAKAIMNPTDEARAEFAMIHEQTDPSASRPMESYLRERKAAGLGPQKDNIVFFDQDAQDQYEAQKNREALDFLHSQQEDGV